MSVGVSPNLINIKNVAQFRRLERKTKMEYKNPIEKLNEIRTELIFLSYNGCNRKDCEILANDIEDYMNTTEKKYLKSKY